MSGSWRTEVSQRDSLRDKWSGDNRSEVEAFFVFQMWIYEVKRCLRHYKHVHCSHTYSLATLQLKRKVSDSQVEFIFTISGLKAGIRNYRNESRESRLVCL